MKKKIIEILNNKSWETLPELLKNNSVRGKRTSPVDEALSDLSNGQRNTLCKELHSALLESLKKVLGDEDCTENSEQQVSDEDKEQHEDISWAVLNLANSILNLLANEEGADICEGLMEMAVLSSGVLIGLNGQLYKAATTYCENWTLNKFDENEHVGGNVFLALLQNSLSDNANKDLVKRMWALRDKVAQLQISGDNADPVTQQQLVSICKSPVFLSCEEGLKLIAHLFLVPDLTLLLHRAVKNVLPNSTMAQSYKYGDIYFHVWKKSQDEQREFFEENCLQDLMYRAVHVDPSGSRLSSNLHYMLSYIHRQKRHPQVSTMICQLYQPFLWRSLKVANGIVRMNAAALLCNAFPFNDTTATDEEREEMLERQFSGLIALLTDPCHLVRITTIKGLTKILTSYWLMIPGHVIKSIFKLFLADLAVDASSSQVRVLVVKAFTALFDCKSALSFIKAVVPRLAGSFDDVNSNVRVAFIKLLLKVKATKCLKYWDIIPLEHLLIRLEMDGSSVGRLITKLLMQSFFPSKIENEELLDRCFSLIEENRGAARNFYTYASRSLDLNTTVHFILLIWMTIRNYITMSNHTILSNDGNETQEFDLAGPSQGRKYRDSPYKKASSSKENKGEAPQVNESSASNIDNKDGTGSDEEVTTVEAENEEDSMPLDNPDTVGGLLDVVAILWVYNTAKLKKPENYKYSHALNSKISRSLPIFCSFFKENSEVSQTLLYISSFLPRATVPTLVGHCLSRVRSISNYESDSKDYVTYVNALCNWNRIDDIIELVSDSLDQAFKSAKKENPKERKRSTRGVRFKDVDAMNPIISLKVIDHILEHRLNRLAVLPSKKDLLIKLVNSMGAVKDLIACRVMESNGPLSDLCTDELLIACWEQYLSLMAVLHNQSLSDDTVSTDQSGEEIEPLLYSCVPQYKTCITWVSDNLVPLLIREESGKRKLRDVDCVEDVCFSTISSLLYMTSNVVMIGAADLQLCNDVCQLADSVLKLDPKIEIVYQCLSVSSEVNQFLSAYFDHTHNQEYCPNDVLKSCINSLNVKLNSTDTNQDFSKISSKLNTTMLLLDQFNEHKCQEIVELIMKTVLGKVILSIDKSKGIDEEITRIKDLGKVPAFYLNLLLARAKFSAMFMLAFTSFINNIEDVTEMLASIFLLSVLKEDSGKISRYNLKQGLMAVDSAMSTVFLPNDEEEDIHGFDRLYINTSKKILKDLKVSMGVL